MKIVISTRAYWPSVGGVQMVTQYLAEGLARLGHNVVIMTTVTPADAARVENHNGVSIKRFKINSCLKVFSKGEKRIFQESLLQECGDANALINVCGNTPIAQQVYAVIDKIKCKKIMYQHGMYDGHLHLDKCYTVGRFLKLILLTPLWECFHRFYWKDIMKFDICIHLFKNDSSYNYFKKNGFDNNEVIINSCERDFFNTECDKSISQKYNINKPYFIYVANYCAGKNQLYGVKQFIASGCERTELVLIGSKRNNYYNSIEVWLKENDPKHKVHLLHEISRPNTIELIKNSLACFVSSNNEYLPITIIEAMASGHPFISTNVGVVGMLPGGNVCITPNDMQYWLKYYEDNPAYVEQLGEIASKYAKENCYLDDKIRQLEEICSNL